jgi:hypothetical protein
MCSWRTLSASPRLVAAVFALPEIPDLPSRYNVAPSKPGAVVLAGEAGRSLFEPPGERDEALAKLKQEVNAGVGRFALRSGATLPLTRIYAVASNEYDICDVRGKSCF